MHGNSGITTLRFIQGSMWGINLHFSVCTVQRYGGILLYCISVCTVQHYLAINRLHLKTWDVKLNCKWTSVSQILFCQTIRTAECISAVLTTQYMHGTYALHVNKCKSHYNILLCMCSSATTLQSLDKLQHTHNSGM